MSAIFDFDSTNWLESFRSALAIATKLAKFTPSKIDDDVISVLTAAIENEAVQNLIEWLIAKHLATPSVAIASIAETAPMPLLAAANEATAGKIGDGKILKLLVEYLPLILSLLGK